MNMLRLPLRFLWRDLRAGELGLLLLALVLAVSSLTSVAFLAERFSRAIERDANKLLGGDVLVRADHALPPSYAAEAQRLGLQQVQAWNFTSMASTAEAAQLAGVKAVGEAYPLRGELRLQRRAGGAEEVAQGGPKRGEVWLDERLFASLGLEVGDTLGLGALRLKVAARIVAEPDRGANFFAFAPRLMMALDDVPASGLVQEGSRVTYRLHLAGAAEAVRAFEAWLKPRLQRGEALESIREARPELRETLERAQQFLRLAALLSIVLAAVAVGLATRRFVQRHMDGCAVMRCCGATQGMVLRLYLGEFLCLGLLAAALGAVLGLVLQFFIAAAVAGMLADSLPAPGPLPALQGFIACLVLLLGFALPQLLRLGQVSTLRVLRREWAGLEGVGLSSWLGAALALAALMLWVAGDLRLGLAVYAGFAVALLLYAALARGLIGALTRLRAAAGAVGGGWRYGLAALGRRANGASIQAMALALGLSAMLLLSVGLNDLLSSWRSKLPADAPNRFIVNIQADQRDALAELFRREGLAEPQVLPMIRGRWVAHNGKQVEPARYADSRARNLAEREFNLSYASALQAGNRVVAGAWHGQARTPQFSVEAGLATRLGIKLGDRLSFEVGGSQVEAEVSSLRELEWDSMRVNFFVIASPGVLEAHAGSFITSFHLPSGRGDFTVALARALPNLTVVDVGLLLAQARATMDSLIEAVQIVFALALLAGFAVMAAALQATHDERSHELAVLRTLGARDSQLRGALLAEFAALGLVAGSLGALGAMMIAAVIAQEVFQFSLQPSVGAFALGGLGGALGVTLAGWLGTRGILRRPPLLSLRALS